MKKVSDWLEWVVGTGFRVSELVKEEFDGGLVSGIEKEVLTKSIEGSVGDGSNGVGFEVVGSEKESEVPFTSGACVIKVNAEYLGSNLVNDRK